MYYPREVVDEVLANTDIVDVISGYVHLQKRGKSYVGLCPFHSEKTPSFHVTPDRGMFYCFGCGTGGSALTFLMKYNNSSFTESLQELADRANITLPAVSMSEESKKREQHRQELLAVNKEAATYYYGLLRSGRGARGLRYFTDRQLTPDTMRAFGLGFADGARSDLTAHLRKKGFSDALILESDVAVYNEKQGLHDRFFNRVMFPIQDVRGRVIGFGGRVLGDSKPKYINSSDTLIFDKGRNLYAMNLAKRSKKDHLILCEGYMDVIAMHQAGFTEAVASLGTAFTAGQAALLKRYTGRVLLAYDSDGAGVRAALRNIQILRAGGLESSVIDLRPHKDPDEFIKSEGREAFQDRIDHAENSFFYELRMLSASYRMDDPASRTAFHREIAKKLCAFTDEIERDNYIAAAADKYFMKEDSLRRLVAQYGIVGGDDPQTMQSRASVSDSTAGTSKETRVNDRARMEDRLVEAAAVSVPQEEIPEKDRAGAGTENTAEHRSAHPGGLRQGNTGSRPARKVRGLVRQQCMLLSWCARDASVFERVRRILEPGDFYGGMYQRIAGLLWEQAQDGREIRPDSVISAFDTSGEQEMASAVLQMPLRPDPEQGNDPEKANFPDKENDPAKGNVPAKREDPDTEKSLRELVTAVKKASLERRIEAPGEKGNGTDLRKILADRQELQALQSGRIKI